MPDTHADTPTRTVEENYAYWQNNGGVWADEYDARKLVTPYYHIQELMLVRYVAECARHNGGTLRVLELGCGVGRHLRNLSRLPGVAAFGYDQSPTMVEGCLRWTGREWLDEHVALGPPTGRLPYPDASFDLVYTSEVLVHVRPEHLDGILAELLRVAEAQVLHFEPDQHTHIAPMAHDGCWNHDLVAAYQRLGRTCEVLPAGYRSQTPYRVALKRAAVPAWPSDLLEVYRRLERDLDAGLREGDSRAQARAATAVQDAETHAASLSAALASESEARARAEREKEDREADAASLRTRVADLERRALELAARHDALVAAIETRTAEFMAAQRESRRWQNEHTALTAAVAARDAERRREATDWVARTAELEREFARLTGVEAVHAGFVAELTRRLKGTPR